MSGEFVVVAVLVAVALGAAGMWLLMKKRRSDHLRRSFGPEYERTVQETGHKAEAERELEHRKERVEQLEIRPLPPGEAEKFALAWRDVQKRFVDRPGESVDEADRLVTEVMQRRGYPMADFERRAADLSVDHPHVVEHYRAGHTLATRNHNGGADTEELRQAMVHYRALFEDLLETPPSREGADA